MKIYDNLSLLGRNTFGIDQSCDRLMEYENENDAADAASECRSTGHFLLLGGGSNLLLTQDFHGLIVTPARRFEVCALPDAGDSDSVLVRCWAGTTFDDVVAYAVDNGYYGLENLSLIPGECGASAVQNIGAYGAEIKDTLYRIEAVEIATGQPVSIFNGECQYSYRQSRFKGEWKDKFIITYVTYRLSKTFRPYLDYGNIRRVLDERHISIDTLTARQLRDAVIDIRRQKLPDPAITGNAGSFFMNPIVDEATFKELQGQHPDIRYFEVECPDGSIHYKIPAGWMIDQCGWKGRSLGPAGVHDKQALVLVNRGGAKGSDIVALMQAIQKDVRDKFGIEIRPEVNVI